MSDLNFTIDKTNWSKVSFGEVVQEVRTTSKNPLSEGLERLVGLEHIEPENIHIKNWGFIKNGTTFNRKFSKGQVLFGRRRAYLKKAAVADFNGICSGDITVMEARDAILVELLPFIVQNEKFFDYAIKNSAGSLSPRVKFKDLANYEFLLPSEEQQKKIAKLLWAVDEMVEKTLRVSDKSEIYFKRYLFDSIEGKFSLNRDKWKEYVLKELGETYSGLNGKSKGDFGSGKPFITYMNIFSNKQINLEQIDRVVIAPGEKQNELKYGDIFFTGSSETPEEVGMSSVLLDEVTGYYLNSFCFGFRLYDFNTLKPEYAKYLFRGEEVRKFMFKHAQGSTRFNLSKTTVKEKLKLIIPPLADQDRICDKLNIAESSYKNTFAHISYEKRLYKSLIKQIF